MQLEYNTERSDVRLKEYGRNIQKLVSHIKTIEDKEKRSAYAQTLTDLMRQINPNVKDSQDYDQKVWDDLYIISNFDMDIDAPFPMPEKSAIGKKPARMPYKNSKIKYMHYGRSVQIMIDQAIQMEDPETKESAIIHIGRLMKTFYNTWNKDNIDEAIILKQIEELSGGKLTIDIEKVKEHGLFNNNIKERRHSGNNNSNNRKRNNKYRRKN
ncbi:uncharacterized protein DUF4290 [Roseivirga pacifica]|uniref:DUF4290 domain-containing protein n=1 Tax=Roseivirga pacifica TaxID=1267423 RepID=A0A1I0RMX5_9BACT|nr:DUF4290 domain-containing protein [Roseivirga pacifica]MCO6358313.1 DUF4290 domain-containing protein [Roseivirga pacifica]MCO6366223.1 DUF4290 domain-containing protein [Roseivirga pacifica]MCO6369226.1 DUF4290 domain-containing protein [Roseivirga pacifica]MCO6374044.1 DUF4290 domain-containing protein [Roseivirga pacifica]MCO6378420.1 DUF4290 domain-containing protein [Roseivirga pacifica]